MIVRPRTRAPCARAIERVLGDPGLRGEARRAGRQRVEENHTTRRFAERLAPILREAGS